VTTQLEELEALRWLKESAATAPELPANVEARLWARVSRDLSILSVGCAGTLPTLGKSASLVSGSWRRVVVSRLALWSAPALVVGAAAGVVGHSAVSRDQVRTVYVDRVVHDPAPSVPATKVESLPLEPDDTTARTTQPAVRAENHAPSTSSEPRVESALGRERAVLDPARAALAAGDPAKALKQVNRHAREFPGGILSEEREAIAINALVTLGNYAQATKRAAAFRARYPRSLMTHSVDAAMAAVPKE